ncbi:MAG: mechanosensitive ion channel [Saprospiraceae bacterium]|nr:mechanosensitive ion channel [Saprospiraceae bacterium]
MNTKIEIFNTSKAVKYLLFLLKLLLLSALVYAKVRADLWEHDFWITFQSLFSLRNAPEPADKFLYFLNIIFSFCILILGLHLLALVGTSIYRRRNNIPKDKPNNVVLGIQNLYILLSTAVFTISILSFFGIDVKSLFTGLTIVAAAIAIITKDYIANILSGIAISFSDELSIDDYVKIGLHKGKVTDISIYRISLLTDDDEIVFIPNNTVYISEIINFTKKGIRRVNIEFELALSSLTEKIEDLEVDLIDCLKDYHDSIEPASFKLKIVDILKDSLKLKFQYTLKHINRELEREIRRKTVRRVVNHIGKK